MQKNVPTVRTDPKLQKNFENILKLAKIIHSNKLKIRQVLIQYSFRLLEL